MRCISPKIFVILKPGLAPKIGVELQVGVRDGFMSYACKENESYGFEIRTELELETKLCVGRDEEFAGHRADDIYLGE